MNPPSTYKLLVGTNDVLCMSACRSSATPLVLDTEPADKKYDQSASKCSMLDELKGKEGKVTGLVVWYEHDVTGFHLASCQPAS